MDPGMKWHWTHVGTVPDDERFVTTLLNCPPDAQKIKNEEKNK